jgi:urea transporter
MDQSLGNERASRIAATLGVAGSVALAYFYVLVPLLTVPGLARYGFYGAWIVLVALSLKWWRRHPWRSLAVPVVGLIAVLVALWVGGEYLGWAP